MTDFSRRAFTGLCGGAAVALSFAGRAARAANDTPIHIGILIPLTGATSQFGASMAAAARAAVDEVNAAGGVRGRKVAVLIEDDQSNPEAAVRAARKLIDVDKVVSIGGSYASAVTSAIAPLCYEANVVLLTSSGADSITKLPHHGYIFRTSPTVTLQGTRVGQFALELGGKNMFFLGPQTPFAQTYIDIISGMFQRAGGKGAGLIYEDKKTSYRTEVDQALRANPDTIVLGGYVPDTAVVLKDLYRAGYTGTRIGFSFGVNPAILPALTGDVGEGTYSLVPSASETSEAYKNLIAKLNRPALDSYSCQVFDHVVLTALALANGPADQVSGTTVRDNIRAVSQSADGKKVEVVKDALAMIEKRETINYDGPSGTLTFAENGDTQGVFFRYEQIRKNALALVKVA